MTRITTAFGVGVVGAALALSVATPVLAWHPKGTIIKQVQNVTSASALADANTAAAAVAAHPGDTLKYVVTVANNGDADAKGYNDMVNTVVTDQLPAGVELVSNPSQRMLSFDLGRIQPGKKVSKEFTVKVTSNKDGDLIDNQACFTGNSEASDNAQKGCDTAKVTVSVPPVPVTPVTPVTPATPEAPSTPATPVALPETGADATLIGTLLSGAAGYLAVMVGRRIRK